MNEVDELDLIQMCGRAGRYGIDDAGFVFVVVPDGSTSKWKAIINNPHPVTSCLKQLDVLAFHVLGEISTKNIINVPGVHSWFERSLAAIQSIHIDDSDVDHVVNDLLTMKMIKKKRMGGVLNVTGMGNVSALMY